MMIRQINLALSIFLLSSHALASEAPRSINSIWINAANDYVMPFDGAKSYAGAPSLEMLPFLWQGESRPLPEGHPAYDTLEVLLPQVESLVSRGLGSASQITPDSVERLVTEGSALQALSSSSEEARRGTVLPRQVGDLIMKSLPDFMTKTPSSTFPDE